MRDRVRIFRIMLYIAVVDIKESFSSVAVYAHGWNSVELLGVQTVRGKFSDRGEFGARKVKETIEILSPREPDVLLLLPRSLLHVTQAEVPAKSEPLLKKMMEFEVTRHFPIAREELVYDYMVVEKPAPGRENFIVNLAGLKRADFEKYLRAAEEAQLNVTEVSYSSVAWVRPEPVDDSEEKRCFIEIVPEGFELSVVEGSRLLYSRFSRFRPKVEEKSFYDDKIAGESPAYRIGEQIREELERVPLVSGIEQMPEYLKRVFIAGGSSLRRSIGRTLSQKPLFSESVIRYMPDDDDAGFDYAAKVVGATSPGRAKERFNFMPDDSRPARREEAGKRIRAALYTALALALLWIVSGYGIEWKKVTYLEKRLTELKASASTLNSGAMPREEYRGYRDSFNRFASAPSLNINMLDALTRALPRETYLTEIDMRPGEITLGGISSDASGLLKILEATPHFHSARMSGAVKAESGRERFRIGMELE